MEHANVSLRLTGFERLELSGVTEVLAFDDAHVELKLTECVFLVGGAGLQIEAFSRETGQALITGRIDSFFFFFEPMKKPGLFSRLFS